MKKVGILAIQGDFERHREAFDRCNVGEKVVLVRDTESLDQVDRLVIPGGESTTVGKLLVRFGLGDTIIKRANSGMPIWGTCMGMILLAREIEGSDQYTLGLMDITVQRNAFGSQAYSFEDSVEIAGFTEPLLGVFIRAPIVTRLGEDVQCLARYKDQIVGIRQGNLIGTSFHPELTDSIAFHQFFLEI